LTVGGRVGKNTGGDDAKTLGCRMASSRCFPVDTQFLSEPPRGSCDRAGAVFARRPVEGVSHEGAKTRRILFWKGTNP